MSNAYAISFETTGLHPARDSSWIPEVVYVCVVNIANVENWRGLYVAPRFDPGHANALGAARIHKLDFQSIRDGFSPSAAAYQINQFTNGSSLYPWSRDFVNRFFVGGLNGLTLYMPRDVKSAVHAESTSFDKIVQRYAIDGPYEPVNRSHARTVQLAKLAAALNVARG
jgi:hypothetical protein